MTARELIEKVALARARRRQKDASAGRSALLRRLVAPPQVPKDAVREPSSLRVEFSRMEIGIRGLPEAFDGFRIAQITDTHLGVYVSASYLQRQIDTLNRIAPDAVVFTGDLVSRSRRRIAQAAHILSLAQAPWGKYAVPGNHDYLAGIDAFRREMTRSGFRVLINDHLRIEKDGACITLAGIDDAWEGAPDHRIALRGIDTRRETVVALAHVPDYLPVLSGSGVDLVLSGHTHGGQVWLPLVGPLIVPSAYGRAYARGLIVHEDMQMYVSRGVGHMLWFRMNCRPELPIIALRRV